MDGRPRGCRAVEAPSTPPSPPRQRDGKENHLNSEATKLPEPLVLFKIRADMRIDLRRLTGRHT